MSCWCVGAALLILESLNSNQTSSHWILLRGLAREARHWSNFPEMLTNALALRGDRARMDAIDLPGTGRYSEMKSPITIGELTEFARDKFNDIRRKMRERGEIPPERTRLLAISMGGMIAADWMQRWPDDFKECVLINTSFQGFSPAHHRLKPSAAAHLLGALRPYSNLERELHSLGLVSNRADRAALEAIAREWSTYADERPVTLENFTRQLLAAARFRAPAAAPDVPILTIYSEHDRMVDSRCSKEIVRRWKTASAVHSTAGHDLTLDDPAWVVEQIMVWETNLREGLAERSREIAP